jgi:uncharacterized membrane protein
MGFDLFSTSLALGGLALCGLLFLFIYKLKRKANSKKIKDIPNDNTLENLLKLKDERPLFFRFKTSFIYKAGSLYVMGIYAVVISLFFAAIIICSKLDIAWFAIIFDTAMMLILHIPCRCFH